MKTIIFKFDFFLIAITTILISFQALSQNTNKTFNAIELNNVICGYSEMEYTDTIISGKNYLILHQNTFANFHALGRDISSQQKFVYHVDLVSGNFIYHKSYIHQGDTEIGGEMFFEDNQLRIVTLEGKEEIIEIPDGTILPNTQLYPYLKNDFENKDISSKKYNVYDLRTGQVKVVEYTITGEEELELAGEKFEAFVLTELDAGTGMSSKMWINRADGMRLKTELPNKMTTYIADSSVPGKIKTGNWDDLFFIKTDTEIHDIRRISYMKAKVKLEAIPNATSEDLNVSGQQFKGNLKKGFIDGEFTISYKKYKGKNAAEFPFKEENYDVADLYLKCEEKIESDDVELITLAQKLTKDCNNLWEASCKISTWVTENIKGGSILDGSAKETYSQRSGICGAQSRLMAALCRAAGIPARVVWGCMYTPEMNGSFGHHAWNELFMGEDGWIPVDVTIHESDYVDSGHIRLGILKTPQTRINYEEIKILDYRL